jgi:hypothetical protein
MAAVSVIAAPAAAPAAMKLGEGIVSIDFRWCSLRSRETQPLFSANCMVRRYVR